MAGQDNEPTTSFGANVSYLDKNTTLWCIRFAAAAGFASGTWIDIELLNQHLHSFDCDDWCNKDVDFAGNPISTDYDQNATNYGPEAASEDTTCGSCENLNCKPFCFPLGYICCKILPNVGVPVGLAGVGAGAAYLSCLLAEKVLNSPSQVQDENQGESPLLDNANNVQESVISSRSSASGESSQQSHGSLGGEEVQLLNPTAVARSVAVRFNMSNQSYGTAGGEAEQLQVTHSISP